MQYFRAKFSSTGILTSYHATVTSRPAKNDPKVRFRSPPCPSKTRRVSLFREDSGKNNDKDTTEYGIRFATIRLTWEQA